MNGHSGCGRDVSAGERWLTAALFFGGGIDIALGLLVAWRSGNFQDFRLFHESAVAVLTGRSPYEGPNLNPPIFVLATSPLGWLPLGSAWLLWQLLSTMAFWWAMRTAWREAGHEPPRRTVALIAMVHASTAAQTYLGQVAWVLTPPIVLAWVASRRERWWTAGMWFGVVVAVKPFLMPVLAFGLVARPWRRLSVAAVVVAAGLTVTALPFVGLETFGAWWNIGQQAWQLTHQPTLASLTGLLYRFGLSAAASVLATIMIWVPLVGLWRTLDVDRQWLAALAAAILTSPLGWIHYSAWLLPLVVATWSRMQSRWRCAGLIAGSIPPVLIAAWPLLQPAYPASVLALFIAALLWRREAWKNV
jgi:hypothetical protein